MPPDLVAHGYGGGGFVALGLNVIAKGVETGEQSNFLGKHGCHTFQGYLFRKPVIVEEFEALLKQQRGNLPW